MSHDKWRALAELGGIRAPVKLPSPSGSCPSHRAQAEPRGFAEQPKLCSRGLCQERITVWGDGDGVWGPRPGSDTDPRLPGRQAVLCQPRSASSVFEGAAEEKAELFPVISFLPKTSCPWPAPRKNQLEVSWLETPELLTLQQQVGENSARTARCGCAPGRARGRRSQPP